MRSVNAREARAMLKRRACPQCGCKELLSEGVDQFCLSCDWDTCVEYVDRGLMNNLELAFREHFTAHVNAEVVEKSKVAQVPLGRTA